MLQRHVVDHRQSAATGTACQFGSSQNCQKNRHPPPAPPLPSQPLFFIPNRSPTVLHPPDFAQPLLRWPFPTCATAPESPFYFPKHGPGVRLHMPPTLPATHAFTAPRASASGGGRFRAPPRGTTKCLPLRLGSCGYHPPCQPRGLVMPCACAGRAAQTKETPRTPAARIHNSKTCLHRCPRLATESGIDAGARAPTYTRECNVQHAPPAGHQDTAAAAEAAGHVSPLQICLSGVAFTSNTCIPL